MNIFDEFHKYRSETNKKTFFITLGRYYQRINIRNWPVVGRLAHYFIASRPKLEANIK